MEGYIGFTVPFPSHLVHETPWPSYAATSIHSFNLNERYAIEYTRKLANIAPSPTFLAATLRLSISFSYLSRS